MKVICDNCGAVVHKKPREVEKWDIHFCDRVCYNEYRRKRRLRPYTVHKDTKVQRKLKAWAKLYAEAHKVTL